MRCAFDSSLDLARFKSSAKVCALVIGFGLFEPRKVIAQDGWYEESERSDSVDEPTLSVSGFLRLQGGIFAPLASDAFRPHENEAFITTPEGVRMGPCNPIRTPYLPCVPVDHGQQPGTLSIGRATLLLEGHWEPVDQIALHAIVRGVRSFELTGDRYSQPPTPRPDPDERAAYNQNFTRDNYYTEFDLRELYLDLKPTDWLFARIGRQQVAWGETSSFRLLDVVNPVNNIWHYGAPLEAFEDTRIPLWMVDLGFKIPPLKGTLELLWVPLIDRRKDTVTVPGTFGGAWGVPRSNTPPGVFIEHADLRYPGGEFSDSRAGARWKGTAGERANYSLVYYYTHQINGAVPSYFVLRPQLLGEGPDAPPNPDWPEGLPRDKPSSIQDFVFVYPRQHVIGGTLEYALESPINMLIRAEWSVIADRYIPNRLFVTDAQDPLRSNYTNGKYPSLTYALSLQRDTFMRALNPRQSFFLFVQFMHSVVPGLDNEGPDRRLVEALAYADWLAQKHTFSVVATINTQYLNGKLVPRFTFVWLPNIYARDSGFYTLELDLRLTTHYRLSVRMTDFFGGDPYREIGFYRDRDELHAALTILF